MPEVVFSVDQSKSMRRPGGAGPQPLASGHPARGVGARRAASSGSSAASGPTRSSATTTRPTTSATSTSPSRTCSAARSRSRAPSRATCSWSTSSTSARASRRRSTATRPGQGWGYTGIFAKANGGGFLTDHFPDAYKAIWDFHGQEATSRHIPGVRYTGITHPGLFGTAPSADLLAEWNRREQALIDTDPDRVPPLALPPLEDGVLAGHADRRRARAGRPRGRAHRARRGRTAATTTSRTSRAAAGSSTRCTWPAPSSPAATCTSPRATARSRSAARSRWAASSTSAST